MLSVHQQIAILCAVIEDHQRVLTDAMATLALHQYDDALAAASDEIKQVAADLEEMERSRH
jgi:hypothetical protein